MELTEFPNKWLCMVLSGLSWCVLYVLVRHVLWPKKSPEFASRIVTLLHGSVAALCGIMLCGMPDKESCFHGRITRNHYALMVWSWGYFCLDLLWCFIYWSKNITMLAHHALSLLCITIYMEKKDSGCIFPCTIALMEATNPLLQTRWFLREEGYGDTTAFLIIEVLYLTSFTVLRGVVGTYLMYKIAKADSFPIQDKLLSFTLYAVSIIFLYELFGFLLYKYKTKIEQFEGFLIEAGLLLDDF